MTSLGVESPSPSRECACARPCDCLSKRSPVPAGRADWTTSREVWHHLTKALATLSENDFGRPWPNPRRDEIARLIVEHPADLCVRAAVEAGQIVQAQDRAPNITALFAKKVADLAQVRAVVRASLEAP